MRTDVVWRAGSDLSHAFAVEDIGTISAISLCACAVYAAVAGPSRPVCPTCDARAKTQGDTMIDEFTHVPIDLIQPSPTNPRRDFGDIEALAEDIARRGILQPLVARKRGDAYELSLGERRLRAAKLAGLQDVPVVIREEPDAAVIEAQVVENARRLDVHPMDEAEAYETLQRDHGYTIERLADQFGHTVRHVRARCKLLALCPEARKLFIEGKFGADIAFLIARIPNAAMQKEAADRIARGWGGAPWSLADARDYIQRDFMFSLADAPFPTDSAKLVKNTPSCSKCPKRTGAQRLLFEEVARADDLCLDPKCFKKKTDAGWRRAKAEAKKQGWKTEPDAKRSELFHGARLSWSAQNQYVDADAECGQLDGKNGTKSWRTLLGDHAPAPVVARDQEGAAHYLYPRKAAEKALRAAGYKMPDRDGPNKAYREQRKQERAQRKLRRRVAAQAIAEVADSPPTGLALLRQLAVLIAVGNGFEATARRREVTYEALRSEIETSKSASWLAGLVLEVGLWFRLCEYQPYGDVFEATVKALGIDLGAIEKRLAAEANKKAAAGKKAAAHKSSKTTAGKSSKTTSARKASTATSKRTTSKKASTRKSSKATRKSGGK